MQYVVLIGFAVSVLKYIEIFIQQIHTIIRYVVEQRQDVDEGISVLLALHIT